MIVSRHKTGLDSSWTIDSTVISRKQEFSSGHEEIHEAPIRGNYARKRILFARFPGLEISRH